MSLSIAGGKARTASSARSFCYMAVLIWVLLLTCTLFLVFSFTRSLRARASEHGLHGGLRSLSLADSDRVHVLRADTHHAHDSSLSGGVGRPVSAAIAANLREAEAGRVRFGPPPVQPQPFAEFCGDIEEDLMVEPGPATWVPVTYPLDEALLHGEVVDCSWVRLDYEQLAVPNLTLCTYDPDVDTVISAAIHREGKWVGVNEWDGLVATGMCSTRRPFVVDVGAGFGSFALMAAAAGCHVIAIEPHAPNMARLMRSFAANGLLDRGTFLLNAVHRRAGVVLLSVEPHNPGAVRVVRQKALAQGVAHAMELRSLFVWAGRPRHPGTGYRLASADVAVLRADTEGHVLAVLDSAKELLAAGAPPVVNLHFYAGLTRNGFGCDARKFLDFGYDVGYKLYLLKDLWSRERWYKYLDEQTWSCQWVTAERANDARVTRNAWRSTSFCTPSPSLLPTDPLQTHVRAQEPGSRARFGDNAL